MKTLNKMMLRAGLAAMAFGMTGSAHAAVVTRTYNFLANGFTPTFVSDLNPAPISSVTGSFTVTFDDQVATTNTASGLTVNNLSISVDSPLIFSYFPGNQFYSSTIQFGGSEAGISSMFATSNDFSLGFNNADSNTPTFLISSYTRAGQRDFNIFTAAWATTSGSVTTGISAGVPEPATWAMMIAGFGLVGAGMRRRKVTPALA